jgi:hypothetical protein
MLCNFCNIARLDNEAPCPNCGAPSPLRDGMNGVFGTSGARGATGARGMMGSGPSAGVAQQAAMPPMPPMSSATGQLGSPFAAQPLPRYMPDNNVGIAFLPQTPQVADQVQQQPFQLQASQLSQPLPASPAAPQSLLPAIYHGDAANQQGQSMMMMPAGTQMGANSALMPLQDMDAGTMLSTIALNEGAVYVAPMYTKPRPLIPRYRAISGLISVLIVVLLACGMAGYYAKSSGQFAFLSRLYGSVLPTNEAPPSPPVLPEPKQSSDYGPAANIITSAATNTRIDSQSFVSEQPSKVFQTGQTIYLTYSVLAPKNGSGTLTIQWYTNNILYLTSAPKVVAADSKNASSVLNGYTTQAFSQPGEEKVVLLWNNQPGITLYFVVR